VGRGGGGKVQRKECDGYYREAIISFCSVQQHVRFKQLLVHTCVQVDVAYLYPKAQNHKSDV
jgi:hypothetical protein